MKWNNGWLWGGVLVVCLGALTMRPLATEPQVKKEAPMPKKEQPPAMSELKKDKSAEAPKTKGLLTDNVVKFGGRTLAPKSNFPLAAIVPPKVETDYLSLVLKLGGLSGALMSVINLITWIVKIVRRKV